MFKTVLFSMDGSREAFLAIDVVANIVKIYQSRLVLLSVVKTENVPDKTSEVMTSEEAVAQILHKAQELFQQRTITAEVIEREGIPAFTICDVAEEIKADLIIMGSRGLGLTHEGGDSVTQRVISLSPCPVLVVP